MQKKERRFEENEGNEQRPDDQVLQAKLARKTDAEEKADQEQLLEAEQCL